MKPLLIAFLTCFLISSCQSTYEVGLKSQVEVSSAKRVAVCQLGPMDRATLVGSEAVSSMFSRQASAITLPKNYTAQAIASTLPKGIEGRVIEGMKPPRIPANCVVVPFRNPDYASVHEPMVPMPNFDLVIQICPRGAVAGAGGGYYNSGAGIYIPTGGSAGLDGRVCIAGYGGGYNPIPGTLTFGGVHDVYVYRGSDGKCLGSFYLSNTSVLKTEDAVTTLKKHVDATARRIVDRILGR